MTPNNQVTRLAGSYLTVTEVLRATTHNSLKTTETHLSADSDTLTERPTLTAEVLAHGARAAIG